jgi:hypothetical protein
MPLGRRVGAEAEGTEAEAATRRLSFVVSLVLVVVVVVVLGLGKTRWYLR